MTKPRPSDLTREKTLLDLYLVGRKFPASRFNIFVACGAFILTTFYSIVASDTPELLISQFRRLNDTGLSFATSILGFLVAGFTVFVTVTKIDIFVEMARKEYASTGESYLKYNLSAFVLVFAHYIAFVFFAMFCVIVFQQAGPAAELAKHVGARYPAEVSFVRKYVASFLFVIASTWSIYLVLLLKSFIYNTYQVVTTQVRWELEPPPIHAAKEKPPEGGSN